MMSVEEALEQILAQITPLPSVQVPLSEALGLVLAEDIVAQEDIPPFTNSAMDGFALLSKDSRPGEGKPPRLRVTGTVAAGYVADHAVQEGTAMRIMTGAPVPPGADSVIQVELTRSEGPQSEWVEILEEVAPGNNIRPAGEDMRRGQTVLTRGSEIGAWEIGVLATLGYASVPVIRGLVWLFWRPAMRSLMWVNHSGPVRFAIATATCSRRRRGWPELKRCAWVLRAIRSRACVRS